MALSGQTFSTIKREVWTPELQNAIWYNNFMFDQSLFEIVTPPPGDTIATGYEYSVSTNTGTYTYDQAMVDPYSTSQIKAYFNKDSYQESTRSFNMHIENRQGVYETGVLDVERKNLEGGVKNLRDLATTTMISDLEGQIDSSTAYSDASLSRTTYATLKSYEESTSTALTLAHLEDLIENLEARATYGLGVESTSDLVFLMPRNQLTNLARLALGTAALTATDKVGVAGAIDAGRVFRTKQFEGIDIVVVPEMTTTVILCCHKPDIKIFENRKLKITEKSEAADTNLNLITAGYNIVCMNPNNSAKLSAKTA
jgi:hypothetical protein